MEISINSKLYDTRECEVLKEFSVGVEFKNTIKRDFVAPRKFKLLKTPQGEYALYDNLNMLFRIIEEHEALEYLKPKTGKDNE